MSAPAVDFYKVLGLPKDASSEDVRRAYKQKVLETHPDKLPPDSTEEEKEAAHEQFSKVHQASEILGNPDRRREYDIHYRELPEPSINSASSPKSSTVSVTRTDSVSTVRTAGSRPASIRRTPSMVSLASTKSATKSHNDSFTSVSRASSVTSIETTLPEKNLSRNNTIVTAPQSLSRTNTITSSHGAGDAPSPMSRANSSASVRQAQGTVSRSNSTATVRSAPAPPSVSRNGTIASGYQFHSPLSRVPSSLSGRDPPASPPLSRANSAATVRSSTFTSAPTHPPQPVLRSNSTRTTQAHLPQPVSRPNSVVYAPPPMSVSRSNSTATVTAISLHETSSIVRSNSNASALTSVSARPKVTRNYSDRLSMLSFASAFSDLPTPPYSHPKDYEALVNAMLQELYRINPEWVERKQRLQQIKAQREAGVKVDSQLLRASWAG